VFARVHRWLSAGRQHPVRSGLLAALLLLGIAAGLYVSGDYREAYRHLQAARQAADQRDFEQATAHLAVCLKTWPQDVSTHLLAAQVARRSGQYDEAEAHLGVCRQQGGQADAIAREQTLVRVQRGELSGFAEQQLWTWAKHDADAVLVLEVLSQAYLRTHRLSEAVQCLDAWLQRRPNDTLALVRRGQAFEQQQRFIDAEADYRRALALDPNHAAAQLRCAQMLLQVGKLQDALVLFESLRAQDPESLAVALGLAQCCSQMGQLEKAQRLLDLLITGHPNHGPALLERGRVARQLARPAEAEMWFRKVVAVAPHDFDANYSLWQSLEAQGKDKEARDYQASTKRLEEDIRRVKDLAREVQEKPRDPGLRCAIGSLFLRLGHEQQGLHWLHSALEIDPTHRPTRQVLADYQAQKKAPAPPVAPRQP